MLSGRKSDVEFEGQQINQQRTTLATETSAYNTQLLGLNVPTAPSSDSYTKNSYTFTNNGNTYNVTSTMYDSATSTYTINATYNTTASAAKTGMSTYAGSAATGYTVGSGSSPTSLTALDLSTEDAVTKAQDESNLNTIFGSTYSTTAGTYYKYTVDGTTRYVLATELADPTTGAGTGTNITYHYVDDEASVTENSKTTGCLITWSDSGRMESFTDSTGKVYTLSVSSTTDDAAYNDAMNEYQYQKALYDQSIDNINAQVDVIQSQDKKLELKLQDLDTQQQALNTEMDSVKKVIDKNIEASFKAFA